MYFCSNISRDILSSGSQRMSDINSTSTGSTNKLQIDIENKPIAEAGGLATTSASSIRLAAITSRVLLDLSTVVAPSGGDLPAEKSAGGLLDDATTEDDGDKSIEIESLVAHQMIASVNMGEQFRLLHQSLAMARNHKLEKFFNDNAAYP